MSDPLRAVRARLAALTEAVKGHLVRTPFEAPAAAIKRHLSHAKTLRHPELAELWIEGEMVNRALQRVLREESCCIDVGCHLGTSLSMFLRLSPRGRHIAFEPLPEKAARLARKFPEVRVHDVAVGDVEGSAPFYRNRSFSGYSGFHRHSYELENGEDDFEIIQVRRKRLDDVLDPDQPVHFLKIDVEGHEISVLRGAQRTLERWRPFVLFESAITGLEVSGHTAREEYEFFETMGYAIHVPRDFLGGLSPVSLAAFEAAHQYPYRTLNFLAVPIARVAAAPDVSPALDLAIGQ